MEFSRTIFAKLSRLLFGFIAFVWVMALPVMVRAQESSPRPADRPASPANLPNMQSKTQTARPRQLSPPIARQPRCAMFCKLRAHKTPVNSRAI
jgi:hypothetical protein